MRMLCAVLLANLLGDGQLGLQMEDLLSKLVQLQLVLDLLLPQRHPVVTV
jgi:hypothetical protein